MAKVLITTSTLPASAEDEVPAFVRDQAIALKKASPALDILLHAPHNAYSRTTDTDENSEAFRVHRYHYFWPFGWELLAGRGIMPALRKNRLLYLQIPFLVFFQFISLLRLTRREKPQLLYAHWFTPQAIITALVSKMTGIPFIFTTHASDVSVLGGLPFSTSLIRRVCRRASAYIAVSNRTAAKLTAFFSGAKDAVALAEKLAVIPMGVDTTSAQPSATDRAAACSRFALPEDRTLVLFIGRLAEKKGVSYLLEALTRLPEATRDSMQLVIAGDGQLRAELESRSAQLGLTNVSFTGYVTGNDKQMLIAAADLACFPSIIDDSGDAEGFPVAVMECLAAGKIVLVSDVTGAETVIAENLAGYVFPQQDSQALSLILQETLELDRATRQQICTNASTLAGNYDWNTIAEQHLAIFSRHMANAV